MVRRFAFIVLVLCVTYPALGDVSSDIGYRTVQEAHESLANNPSASPDVEEESGWVMYVLQDADQLEIWTFPPVGSPAYPAAIRQEVVETEDAIDVQLHILCEAARQQCAQLEEEYVEFTSKLIESLSNG